MAPFYRKGVAPHVTHDEIFSGAMPYIWIVVAFTVAMYAFPDVALWLAKYMYG
jgi:TRAP-type mannitol/chloroaromatic compound transport system permease large subunit